ncbi:hypothetical protein HDU67_005428 [Dinochytrium kinnereticum]|nr:hypothetical protein HDU67_005428 [Dinochytrium kinnereticum]
MTPGNSSKAYLPIARLGALQSATPAPRNQQTGPSNTKPQNERERTPAPFPFPTDYPKTVKKVAVNSERRIPGPAGELNDFISNNGPSELPMMPLKRGGADGVGHPPRFARKRRKGKNDLPKDVSNDPEFGLPPWQLICDILQKREGRTLPLVCMKDIVKASPIEKVSAAVGVVHEIKFSDSGANVVLKDPTGDILVA